MKTDSPFRFYFRILLVSIFIALLGLGPAPHSIDSSLQKAYQSAASGDLMNAAEYLANVAGYYPWRADLFIQAGRYAYQAGDAKIAIQYLEHPGTDTLLTTDDMILLGDAYNQSGNPLKAEAIWKDVLKVGNSNQAIQRLVDLYLQKKDYESAVSYLQKLLTSNPSDAHLYYQLGLIYAMIEPIKALPYLAQAVEIDPAYASQAKALHDKIRTANLFDQPAYTLLAAGRQLANMGEWVYAAGAFQRAIDLRSDYADAWAFLGEAQQQIQMQETGAVSKVGLSELEHALQLDPKSTLANTYMGLYWERQQAFSQAQYYLEQAIALNSADPYLYSELGNILSKDGDLPAAQTAFETAIHLAPQDPLFYCLLVEFALENQIQIRELALPAARQAIMLDPHDPGSLDAMAQVMLVLEDYHSAERFSTDALTSDPGYAPAYLHLGTAYLLLGESDLAQQWLAMARNVDLDSWVSAQASRMIDYYFP